MLLVLPMAIYQHYQGKASEGAKVNNQRSRFLSIMLTAGLTFLYVPMILLIIYSFNYSKLVQYGAGGPPAGTLFCSNLRKSGMQYRSV